MQEDSQDRQGTGSASQTAALGGRGRPAGQTDRRRPNRREKLGLALAGGGFRASLFHVGVLRYLAQADLLRQVEVLSTVSGGSLVGALYLLHLKAALEREDHAAHQRGDPDDRPLCLSQEQYLAIVESVALQTRRLVGQNLRMRLLLNPWRWVWISLGLASLGRHFSRYLDRHLFGEISRELRRQAWERHRAQQQETRSAPGWTARWMQRWRVLRQVPDHPDFSSGLAPRLNLRALRLCAARVEACGGTENYNRAALWDEGRRAKPASAVTRLILNTTSLNSSGRFWFSHAEFGEWYLGYVRHADIQADLWPRKWLLQEARSLCEAPDGEGRDSADCVLEALAEACRREFRVATLPDQMQVLARMRERWPLLRWWRGEAERLQWRPLQALEERLALTRPAPGRSSEAELPPLDALAVLLRDMEMGRARQLKNFAWLLQVGRHGPKGPPVRDGMCDRQLAAAFAESLQAVDEAWLSALGLEKDPAVLLQGTEEGAPLQPWGEALMVLVIEVYQCRCAEFMSPHVWQDWQDMPLAEAVAASASFPPVFPPHVLSILVDDRKVRTLGLTDGGVFDNLGSTALLDEQCTMVIASDPGGVFDTRAREVSVGRLGLMGRLAALLGERPNQLFRHELRERRRMGEVFEEVEATAGLSALADAACVAPSEAAARRTRFIDARALTALSTFRIAPAEDLQRRGSRGQLLSAIRTDLDVFGPLEQEALIQQGERQAQRHLQRRFGPRAGRPLQVEERPLPEPAPLNAREQEILDIAAQRFWRLPRLAPVRSLLVLALLMASAWLWHWPAALGSMLPELWQGLERLPQGLGLLDARVLAWLWSQVAAWDYLPVLALPTLPLTVLCLRRARRGRVASRQGRGGSPGGRRVLGQSWATWRRWLRRGRGLAVYLAVGLLLLPGWLGPLWLMMPLLFALSLTALGLLALGATWLYLRLTRAG